MSGTPTSQPTLRELRSPGLTSTLVIDRERLIRTFGRCPCHEPSPDHQKFDRRGRDCARRRSACGTAGHRNARLRAQWSFRCSSRHRKSTQTREVNHPPVVRRAAESAHTGRVVLVHPLQSRHHGVLVPPQGPMFRTPAHGVGIPPDSTVVASGRISIPMTRVTNISRSERSLPTGALANTVTNTEQSRTPQARIGTTDNRTFE